MGKTDERSKGRFLPQTKSEKLPQAWRLLFKCVLFRTRICHLSALCRKKLSLRKSGSQPGLRFLVCGKVLSWVYGCREESILFLVYELFPGETNEG